MLYLRIKSGHSFVKSVYYSRNMREPVFDPLELNSRTVVHPQELSLNFFRGVSEVYAC